MGLLALLTITMLRMKDVIEALKEAGVREKVRVMIGGAPITQLLRLTPFGSLPPFNLFLS